MSDSKPCTNTVREVAWHIQPLGTWSPGRLVSEALAAACLDLTRLLRVMGDVWRKDEAGSTRWSWRATGSPTGHMHLEISRSSTDTRCLDAGHPEAQLLRHIELNSHHHGDLSAILDSRQATGVNCVYISCAAAVSGAAAAHAPHAMAIVTTIQLDAVAAVCSRHHVEKAVREPQLCRMSRPGRQSLQPADSQPVAGSLQCCMLVLWCTQMRRRLPVSPSVRLVGGNDLPGICRA